MSRVHPLFQREERAVLYVSSESVHAEFLQVPLFPGQEHDCVRNSFQEEWIRAVEKRHVDIFTGEGFVELAEDPGVEAPCTENADIQVASRMDSTFHAGTESHDERDIELPSECIELLLLGRRHFHHGFIIKGSCTGVKAAQIKKLQAQMDKTAAPAVTWGAAPVSRMEPSVFLLTREVRT